MQHSPRSPGTHIVGPRVIDSINLYMDLRTGTQYVGNWASRASSTAMPSSSPCPPRAAVEAAAILPPLPSCCRDYREQSLDVAALTAAVVRVMGVLEVEVASSPDVWLHYLFQKTRVVVRHRMMCLS